MNFFDKIRDKNSVTSEQIKNSGSNDGGFEIPKSDDGVNSNYLSEMQIKINQTSYNLYQENVDRARNYFKSLEEGLVVNEGLVREDGHDSMMVDLKGKVEHQLTGLKHKIKTIFKNYQKSETIYKKFILDNNLQRLGEIKSVNQKCIYIFLVSLIFCVEVVTNTTMLTNAIPGGILGAAGLAFVISLLNILLSFLVGRLLLPNLNLIDNKSNNMKKSYTKLMLASYALVIIYFNFALGVLRSAAEGATASFSSSDISSAASNALWPFDDFASLEITSSALIVIGMVFAIIALLDGYFYDDKYPEFGKKERDRVKAEKLYSECLSDANNALDEERTNGLQQIKNFREKRDKANNQIGNVIDEIDSIFLKYKSWSEALKSQAKSDQELYISANVNYRGTPPPASFSNPQELNIQEDPKYVFSSIAHHCIDDEAKIMRISKSQETIVTEFNSTTKKLGELYQQKADELKMFIEGLR
jgi:hypothetical protein